MTHRPAAVLVGFAILLPISLAVALSAGAFPVPVRQIPALIMVGGEGAEVLRAIRIPRVVLAGLVGATLALGGAVLQGVFRNPLADPGLIGVTAGAALGAGLWIVLGPLALTVAPHLEGTAGPWGTAMGAFAGALGATAVVWRLARGDSGVSVPTLLLAGVALTSLAGASLGFLLFLADDHQLRALTFWTLGGLGGATWSTVTVTAAAVMVGVTPLLFLARPLNALLLGERDAFHLGVSVQTVTRTAVVCVALSVGASVAAAGGIGFVGLVVPHLIRLLGGSDHRFLLPASALGGAVLLILADLFSRTVAAPAELPVGVVTALMGAPFFLWLLVQRREGMRLA